MFEKVKLFWPFDPREREKKKKTYKLHGIIPDSNHSTPVMNSKNCEINCIIRIHYVIPWPSNSIIR